MKSYKKITETAQTFNFSDFPLKRDESYANANAETVGQNHFFLENKVVINFDFRSGAKKSGHLDYPLQSYGPKVITPPKRSC